MEALQGRSWSGTVPGKGNLRDWKIVQERGRKEGWMEVRKGGS
jgi:hypothetical protein